MLLLPDEVLKANRPVSFVVAYLELVAGGWQLLL